MSRKGGKKVETGGIDCEEDKEKTGGVFKKGKK